MKGGADQNIGKDMTLIGESASSSKQEAFMNFLAKYGRSYASKHDMTSKFTVFSENYDKIEEHNAKN